jgi:D-3-phosphoglycerate dehydrogenase
MNFLNIDPYLFSEKTKKIISNYFVYTEKSYSYEELLENISNYEILFLRFSHVINKDIIDKGINLRIIATNATGTNHIDTEYAISKGIQVISLKGEVNFLNKIYSSSEHTWALLLALSRKLPQAVDHCKKLNWNRNDFVGNDLANKTIGILGFGRNGKKIMEYANAFSMNVLIFDKIKYKKIKNYSYKYSNSIDDLFLNSDIIIISITLQESTIQIVSKDLINLLKPHSLIINTSRGEVVDEDAIYEAIISNKISGYASDVLSFEHDKDKRVQNKLFNLSKINNNVIFTPHIGGATFESWEKTELFIIEKIIQNIEFI